MAHAPMFARAMGLPARLALYCLASLALMVVDSRYAAMTAVKTSAAEFVYPIQAILARPFGFLNEAGDFFMVHGQVLGENRRLILASQVFASHLQGYEALKSENVQLRGLLNLPLPVGVQARAAEIVRILPDPFNRRVIVDKGAADGVTAGRPVVDAAGLVGQVTQVYADHSEVSLLTAKEQAAPVQNQRNGLRLIVSGAGSDDRLEVRYLDMHADIKPGDILVTSGIDGVYPLGIPVARVLQVEPPRQTPFAKAICQPIGAIGQHRHLLILGRAEVGPARQPTQ
ncbi:MAG: rod shape-determining protein MreC [Hydrogenophilales bacterium CG03_land_8_20_14_0_80_62_28]|nr:rod shape-determining protein MreC [Betaproteobacteria bacterium]OIO78116.1 MAG: rod shape-determining protein MreC [Hydrogenophilaceae bacterium CG1_02_62_390]PIV21810.1 MAG: rod shape-determining protein MreC [Hydrogenophilales bacterium CG03_land_8_20_14_0_80_62_28]PIW38856.1 MAG: rod shape-determining protein MreC [Hydrogenophilales bacterium CG15_BIG_FIL_POST_REV_8_21_14_020_62_31]PIW72626.1 MAG: rod shape-determining protein MreC [Hydrogenophilales bacterium CG12_big_fil_rev_8_21_14_0_